MKNFLLLILLNLGSLLVYSQSLSLPYSVDFDNGLPNSWSSSNFWKPTTYGVQNTGGMVAKDHVAIIANCELITPYVDLSGTTHPVLKFDLTMGRFPDGTSNFTVHADYGNGWVPIFGCSQDTTFGFSIYPNLYKVKTRENIYSIADTASWIPNPQVPYQDFTLKLDSLKDKSAIRFKFLAYFYYGGVVYLDNVKIENQTTTEIDNPNKISTTGYYFTLDDNSVWDIHLNEPVSEFQIINSNGKNVYHSQEITQNIKLPSSILSAGIYLIKFKNQNSGKIGVQKLILN